MDKSLESIWSDHNETEVEHLEIEIFEFLSALYYDYNYWFRVEYEYPCPEHEAGSEHGAGGHLSPS